LSRREAVLARLAPREPPLPADFPKGLVERVYELLDVVLAENQGRANLQHVSVVAIAPDEYT
jgi:hypothetical protein